MGFDVQWSRKYRPFGIHYCGQDPHRYAARSPGCRTWISSTSAGAATWPRCGRPARYVFEPPLQPRRDRPSNAGQIRQTVRRLVHESGNPWLTGVCCINMDQRPRRSDRGDLRGSRKRSGKNTRHRNDHE